MMYQTPNPNLNQQPSNQQPSNQELLFALSQIGTDLSHNNSLMLATFNELAQKNQRAMQKKRRVRTSEQLLVAPGHYPKVQYSFDNGDTLCLDLTHDVTGENVVFNLVFENCHTSSHFGIFFKAENVMVLGDKTKLRSGYLYERFIRTGIQFNRTIPISIIKRLIFEFWAPHVDMAESTLEIPALSGWFNGEFWHKNKFPYRNTTDFPELQIFRKGLTSQKMDKTCRDGYFEEMRQIQRWQDRFVIASCPFYGLLSSLFRAENIDFPPLNLVLLQEFDLRKICYWIQIYNRERLMPFSLDVNSKDLQKILQDSKDEALIFDASTDGSETPYVKRKIEQNIHKIINFDKKITAYNTIPANNKIILSSNLIIQDNILNIFIDTDFFEDFSDQYPMTPTDFGTIFSNFIEFIESNLKKTLQIIRKRRKDIPEKMKFLTIIHEILTEFWKEEGIDFQTELDFPLNWTFDELSEYFDLGESPDLETAFVEAVRREIKNYYMEEKCYGGTYFDDTIYYDDAFLYFPTDIFEDILHSNGMAHLKSILLLELQKNRKILREGRSIAKTPQIGGVRFEAYVIHEELFRIPGRPELIALGKEKK